MLVEATLSEPPRDAPRATSAVLYPCLLTKTLPHTHASALPIVQPPARGVRLQRPLVLYGLY